MDDVGLRAHFPIKPIVVTYFDTPIMFITTSIIMKTQEQTSRFSLEILKYPLFVLLMIIGSPFYLVHKLVQWTSVKTDKATNTVEVALN